MPTGTLPVTEAEEIEFCLLIQEGGGKKRTSVKTVDLPEAWEMVFAAKIDNGLVLAAIAPKDRLKKLEEAGDADLAQMGILVALSGNALEMRPVPITGGFIRRPPLKTDWKIEWSPEESNPPMSVSRSGTAHYFGKNKIKKVLTDRF